MSNSGTSLNGLEENRTQRAENGDELNSKKSSVKDAEPLSQAVSDSRSSPEGLQESAKDQPTATAGALTNATSASQHKLNGSLQERRSGSSVSSLQPRDSFTDQFLASAAKLKNTIVDSAPVSFRDIAANPSLGRRARAEMNSHQLGGALEGMKGNADKRPHDMEVARLQVALDAVDADAEEEARACSQLSHSIIQRLDSSRRAVERLLGILQAVSSAEAAYTRAMRAVSRVSLASDSDGPSLKTALLRFSDIPFTLAEGHDAIACGMSDVTKTCQDAVRDMRKEFEALAQASKHSQNAVAAARKNLHSAFLNHRTACSLADDALAQSQKPGHRKVSNKIELDPWISEARVMAVQATLTEAQKGLRSILESACGRVSHYEEWRAEMLRDIVHSFLHSYKSQLGQDGKNEKSMLKVLDDLSPTEDAAQFTASVRAWEDSCRDLSERQNQAIETASQDLLCSPDIIRQGQMARWITGSGKWLDCQFVLTKSGFLHWLADAESYTPQGSLNLARCQFEAGDAPKFHIIESAANFFGKAKKMMFEAPSVEECCEWAIAIRESIASHKA